MEEIKTFKKTKEGLAVTITSENRLTLPGSIDIGSQEQITIQKVDTDKIVLLKDFVKQQLDQAETQYAKMENELEQLKDIDIAFMPEDIVKSLREVLVKGSKAAKKTMININNHIAKRDKKSGLLGQKDYLDKQLAKMRKDYEEISKY